MQSMLIINQKLLILKILNDQNLKQNLILKLKIILKILFFLLKIIKVFLNYERKLTKNIFLISAFDIDIEQFFNTARNVCHYYQNYLNTDIIEIIMLLK